MKIWAIGGRKPKLTPEQAAEVRAWAAQRKTLAQKAAELGVAESTVKNYINAVHKRAELRSN